MCRGRIKSQRIFPSESDGPRGSLTQHLQPRSTAPPGSSGPSKAAGPQSRGRVPSHTATSRRWPRWDRRPAIWPAQGSRGRFPHSRDSQSSSCPSADGRDVPADAAPRNLLSAGSNPRAVPLCHRRFFLVVNPPRVRCPQSHFWGAWCLWRQGRSKPATSHSFEVRGGGGGGGRSTPSLQNQLIRVEALDQGWIRPSTSPY